MAVDFMICTPFSNDPLTAVAGQRYHSTVTTQLQRDGEVYGTENNKMDVKSSSRTMYAPQTGPV
jgi:hypothetical protein